jgi:hypothetical protein
MAQTLAPHVETSWVDTEIEVSRATWQAYQILYYAFIALFAIAGIDKFLHVLTVWEAYVAPGVASLLHMTRAGVTALAGLVEIAAAAGVALKPRIGSWVVTVWLWLVVINLLSMEGKYDIAFMDLVLSVAGLAFTRLAAECN